MPNESSKPGGEVILFQTEDAQTRLQVRLDGQTAWLTQAQMAELFKPHRKTSARTCKTAMPRTSCSLRKFTRNPCRFAQGSKRGNFPVKAMSANYLVRFLQGQPNTIEPA